MKPEKIGGFFVKYAKRMFLMQRGVFWGEGTFTKDAAKSRMKKICATSVKSRVPIAHIHGRLMFGVVDDCMRHAITKMGYLHFVSAEECRSKIIQMVEEWKMKIMIDS